MTMPAINIKSVLFACRLMELGVRPHLVGHHLSITHKTIRKWYWQLTGKRTKRGPLKQCVSSYVKTRSDARLLSVFCLLYNSVKDGESPSIEYRIRAIERYNKLCSDEPIDGTMAWFAMVQLDSKQDLKLKMCKACGVPYVHLPGSAHLNKCAVCPSGNGKSS